MVKIGLQIKASLDCIEWLKPSGETFRWYLKFVCNNCGSESQKWNYVSLAEAVPAERGNAVHHFVQKCKLCIRENSMTILNDTIQPYTAEDEGNFKTVVVFDCRGLEPSDFHAREGWTAKAIDGGKEFTDVDLSEGEWADYCDKINKPVTIYEIEHRFERVKL